MNETNVPALVSKLETGAELQPLEIKLLIVILNDWERLKTAQKKSAQFAGRKRSINPSRQTLWRDKKKQEKG